METDHELWFTKAKEQALTYGELKGWLSGDKSAWTLVQVPINGIIHYGYSSISTLIETLPKLELVSVGPTTTTGDPIIRLRMKDGPLERSFTFWIFVGGEDSDETLEIRAGKARSARGGCNIGDGLDVLQSLGIITDGTIIHCHLDSYSLPMERFLALPDFSEAIDDVYVPDKVGQFIVTHDAPTGPKGYIVFVNGRWVNRALYLIKRFNEPYTIRLAEPDDDFAFVSRLNREIGLGRLLFYNVPALDKGSLMDCLQKASVMSEAEVTIHRRSLEAERVAAIAISSGPYGSRSQRKPANVK